MPPWRVAGTPAPTLPGESPPGPTRRSRRATHPLEVDEEVVAENRLGPQERIDYWRDVAFRRLQAEQGVRFGPPVPTPVQGAGPLPFYLTLPFRLGGVPPRQSHETEAAVAVHGRGRMVQRLALTKRWSIGLRFLLWDRPRSASMSVLRHGSRRTPKLTPPSMPIGCIVAGGSVKVAPPRMLGRLCPLCIMTQ